MLRRIFEPIDEDETKVKKNSIMMDFIICTPQQVLLHLSSQVRDGRSCSMSHSNEKCIQNFAHKTQKEVTTWQT
jgi:hypothetical protein